MEITLIGTLPPIKGISDYCIELTEAISKKIKVHFISFKNLYPDFLYPGGTKDNDRKFRFNKNKNISIYNILVYYNPMTWIKAGFTPKTKIIHMQWWTTVLFPIFFFMCLILKLRRKKIIFTVHNILGHESGFFDKLLNKIIFMFPDKFIVHSSSNKVQMIKNFNISKDKLIVVPHGVYNFYEDVKVSKGESRKRLKLAKEPFVILCFGNIREYKGIDILLKAFHLLNQRVENSILIIAGKCWIDWDKYQKLINVYNLNKKVRLFLDYIPMSNVKLFFSSVDLVVLPYKKFEAQSGPGNIALAFGKPLLVTNVGGLSDLVIDKRFVVGANSNSIADRLIKIAENGTLLKKLAKDSKLLAKKYSWDEIAKRTIRLYKTV